MLVISTTVYSLIFHLTTTFWPRVHFYNTVGKQILINFENTKVNYNWWNWIVCCVSFSSVFKMTWKRLQNGRRRAASPFHGEFGSKTETEKNEKNDGKMTEKSSSSRSLFLVLWSQRRTKSFLQFHSVSSKEKKFYFWKCQIWKA